MIGIKPLPGKAGSYTACRTFLPQNQSRQPIRSTEIQTREEKQTRGSTRHKTSPSASSPGIYPRRSRRPHRHFQALPLADRDRPRAQSAPRRETPPAPSNPPAASPGELITQAHLFRTPKDVRAVLTKWPHGQEERAQEAHAQQDRLAAVGLQAAGGDQKTALLTPKLPNPTSATRSISTTPTSAAFFTISSKNPPATLKPSPPMPCRSSIAFRPVTTGTAPI